MFTKYWAFPNRSNLVGFVVFEAITGEPDPFVLYLLVVDPILRGLRDDPRGQALLKRMNLPR